MPEALPAWDELLRGGMVGAGFFGGVRAMWRGDQRFGLKLVPLAEENEREADAARLAAECKKLAVIEHPNLRRVYGFIVEPGTAGEGERIKEAGILCELWPRNLVDYIEDPATFSWQDKWLRIAVGVATGVAHLHASGLTHGTLKPTNVLLSRDLVPKVCDGGVMALLSTPEPVHVYLAVEQLKSKDVLGGWPSRAKGDPALAHTVDIWSLGGLLIAMATRRPPYGDFIQLQKGQKWKSFGLSLGTLNVLAKNIDAGLTWPAECMTDETAPSLLIDLATACTKTNQARQIGRNRPL